MKSFMRFIAIAVAVLLYGAPAARAVDYSQSTLCASSDNINKVSCRVHREVLYLLSEWLKAQGATIPSGPLATSVQNARAALGIPQVTLDARYQDEAAMRAAEIVPQVLSTLLYGHDGLAGPALPTTLAGAVDRGIGICGWHTELFLRVMSALGINARPVQFWWRRNGVPENHIAAEAFLNGKWVLFDPTFSARYFSGTTPLGTLEARATQFTSTAYTTGGTYRYYTLSGRDPNYHLTADVDVTFSYKGEIRLFLDQQGSAKVSNFAGIPNYAGDNTADGVAQGLSFKIAGLTGSYSATINVLGSAGCATSLLKINNVTVPMTVGAHTVTVSDSATISVVGADDVCYVVMSSVSFTPSS